MKTSVSCRRELNFQGLAGSVSVCCLLFLKAWFLDGFGNDLFMILGWILDPFGL